MKTTSLIRACIVAGSIGLMAGMAQPANAVTAPMGIIEIISESGSSKTFAQTITCVSPGGAVCTGIVDYGDGFDSDNATAFSLEPGQKNPKGITEFLGGLVNGRSFETGTRSEAGNLDCDDGTCTVMTDFEFVGFKFSNFVAFVRNTSRATPLTLSFAANGDNELSNITEIHQLEMSIIPVPASLPLFLTGLLGLGFLSRRRRQSAA